MSIWKILGIEARSEAESERASAETVRKISERLGRLDRERARFVAAFAYILSRVAHTDLEISEFETRAMERIVRDLGGLGADEAALVVEIAKSQTLLFGSTENYIVTREFASSATHEQKLRLLECLFAVSASDQEVSGAEEAEIRRVVTELDLEHAHFIEARVKFREYISVLKREGGRSQT